MKIHINLNTTRLFSGLTGYVRKRGLRILTKSYREKKKEQNQRQGKIDPKRHKGQEHNFGQG